MYFLKKNTKIFLLLCIIFLSSNMGYSMPGFDPNNNEPIFYVYDVTYDIELRNKLEDNFYKKYVKKIDDTHYVDTSPLGAYSKEVVTPYCLIKKTDEEAELSNDSKKSKKELLKEINEDIAYYYQLEDNFNKTCNPGFKLYNKKLEEFAKKHGILTQFHKDKIYMQMIADGTMCNIWAHEDMVWKPLHDRRMNKLKNNK